MFNYNNNLFYLVTISFILNIGGIQVIWHLNIKNKK